MADDPSHKAMLHFLEILMYGNEPMVVSQLAEHLHSRNFTQEMRSSVGGNETGLRMFLLRYPSLFSVNENLVSLNDGKDEGGIFRESSPNSSSSQSASDVPVVTEAVRYFCRKLIDKPDWTMPVKSLAGHLSQASVEIRRCVGPQSEFFAWIRKHPLIFEVNEECVSLKGNMNFNAANPSWDRGYDQSCMETPFIHLFQSTPKPKGRPKSLEVPVGKQTSLHAKDADRDCSVAKHNLITMSVNEYKAVMFIKSIIDKKGNMKVNSLSCHFSRAPESLRNSIGWSEPELERFLKSHDNIFALSSDNVVSVIKNTRLNVIITESRSFSNADLSVRHCTGTVFHVAKLWGIIDLGKHEHVFVDRTIFGKKVDDLNGLLKVGEMVTFNAIPAAKGSRSRWRATKVWKGDKCFDDLVEESDGCDVGNFESTFTEAELPLSYMNDAIRGVYPDLDDSQQQQATTLTSTRNGNIRHSFTDVSFSSEVDFIPSLNFVNSDAPSVKSLNGVNFSCQGGVSTKLCPFYSERSHINGNIDVSSQCIPVNGQRSERTNAKVSSLENWPAKQAQSVSTSCQTVVTGEVLATQFYHESI